MVVFLYHLSWASVCVYVVWWGMLHISYETKIHRICWISLGKYDRNMIIRVLWQWDIIVVAVLFSRWGATHKRRWVAPSKSPVEYIMPFVLPSGCKWPVAVRGVERVVISDTHGTREARWKSVFDRTWCTQSYPMRTADIIVTRNEAWYWQENVLVVYVYIPMVIMIIPLSQ